MEDPSHPPASIAPWVAETPLTAACPQTLLPGGSQLHATSLQLSAMAQQGTLADRSPSHPWQPKEPLLSLACAPGVLAPARHCYLLQVDSSPRNPPPLVLGLGSAPVPC